jgi:hypothetical protein
MWAPHVGPTHVSIHSGTRWDLYDTRSQVQETRNDILKVEGYT